MDLSNIATRAPMRVEKGHTFSCLVRIENRQNESVVNIADKLWFTVRDTPYSVEGDDDANAEIFLEFEPSVNLEDELVFYLVVQGNELNLDPEGEWYYAISWLSNENYSMALAAGTLIVSPNVTNRGVGADEYAGDGAATELVIQLGGGNVLLASVTAPPAVQGASGWGLYTTEELLDETFGEETEVLVEDIDTSGGLRIPGLGDHIISLSNGIFGTVVSVTEIATVVTSVTVESRGNFQGPQGPAGADGVDGVDGATGPQGPAGPPSNLSTTPDNMLTTDSEGLYLSSVGIFNAAPPGTIMQGLWASAPSGWAFLDGSAFNTSLNPVLFALFPTGFLPNVAGHTLVSIDPAVTAINAVAKTRGSDTVVLSTPNLPSHSHGLNSHTHGLGGHTHGLNSHTHSLGDHTHPMPHTHGLGSHVHEISAYSANTTLEGNHTHSIDHTHPATYTTGSAGLHSHTTGLRNNLDAYQGGGSSNALHNSFGSLFQYASSQNGAHTHSIPAIAFDGNSGGAGSHTHIVNLAAKNTGAAVGSTDGVSTPNTGAATGTTGAAAGSTAAATGNTDTPSVANTTNTGSGAAVSVVSRQFAVKTIIRLG